MLQTVISVTGSMEVIHTVTISFAHRDEGSVPV
jgi:hypothetical protein